MHRRRLLIAGLVSLSAAAPVIAQSAGNVELGGFAQYTHADEAWQVNSGFGFGGRLGVFLNSRWALEGDASFSTFDNKASRGSGSSDQQTFAGRVVYNLPFGVGGRTHQFLLEPGAGEGKAVEVDGLGLKLRGQAVERTRQCGLVRREREIHQRGSLGRRSNSVAMRFNWISAAPEAMPATIARW